MSNIKDNNDIIDYEISYIPYESFTRERPPFIPGFPGGGNFPTPALPQGPPNYIPSKKDKGVQNFKDGKSSSNTKAVSHESIRFCLFKFTYIWEENGRSYWTFLINVDKRSISGFRWLGRNWVYFGLDLKRIDSFICYRSEINDNCDNCRFLNSDNISLSNSKTQYFLDGTRDVYTTTLDYISIPEIKEDFLIQTLGYNDDNEIKSEIPCIKARNINYKIFIEVAYPSSYNQDLKLQIKKFATDASNAAYKKIISDKNFDTELYNPLERFNHSSNLIPELLKSFSEYFDPNLHKALKVSNEVNNVSYLILKEQTREEWKPYNYKNFSY